MKTIDQELAGPNTSLQTGDVLYVLGAFAQIELLTKDNNLDLLDTHTAEVSEETSFPFDDVSTVFSSFSAIFHPLIFNQTEPSGSFLTHRPLR